MEKSKNGYECWLSYGSYAVHSGNREFQKFGGCISMPRESPILTAAAEEWSRAMREIFSIQTEITHSLPEKPCILLETNTGVPGDQFTIRVEKRQPFPYIRITGNHDASTLYGVFELLRSIGLGKSPAEAETSQNCRNELRMLDHWDNMDGSIERGYAGHSIFFHNNQVSKDFRKIKDYARLISSVGINAVTLNNVNVFSEGNRLITERYLPDLSKIADIFSQYGIRTFLSVNFASPLELGGLSTADPLNQSVQNWWKQTVQTIYQFIPNFGGFLVKADSESRPGPYTYGRSHAQGANMLADALKPFGGLVIWRCFVYNCHLDWRDRSLDRAKMAYENFKPLDGKFNSNVILQIKNGPMDFQIREPVSPLFGALRSTNQIMECQITQEYTGQQKDLCYLVPIWKEALDFDTRADGGCVPVSHILDGTQFHTCHGGLAGVANVGDSPFWTGNPLAQANLYGFGRLCWQPSLSSEEIAKEWTALTFGSENPASEKITGMLMKSRTIYENYTCPLGIGWFVNPEHHYGPSVDGYEYSRWGTYHYADCKGIGVDRTAATGTGFTAQYQPQAAEIFDNLKTCPENLLLFFHHVPYSYRLKNGETLLQHIYNTHFDGYNGVVKLKEIWLALKGKIDGEIYEEVSRRLDLQLQNAREWRDVVNTYFYRKTGIADQMGRKIYP